MAEIAKARQLGAEIDTHVSITRDAINLDTSSHDIFHTRSDQLLVATHSLLASGRLSEHFYQIPSFNRMYPFCLTLDERQSIGQKRTGRRANQQPTGKPIVPQPERLNEIFPTTEEVGDCPADGAKTSRSEDEGKLHQAAAPMSKSQGPAGDYINAKILPALGTAALNRTEEEDPRREVAEPATELTEAQRQLQVLPTAMSHGGFPTIKQPDLMVKIKTSQPMQGKSAELPLGAMTDTPAPTLALANARAEMETAQLALEALDAHYSGRAGAMPWCEHFDWIGVEWQWMEMGRKTVDSTTEGPGDKTAGGNDDV